MADVDSVEDGCRQQAYRIVGNAMTGLDDIQIRDHGRADFYRYARMDGDPIRAAAKCHRATPGLGRKRVMTGGE